MLLIPIKDHWKRMTDKVMEKWGQLTFNELTAIDDQRNQLVRILKERYGYAEERADEELSDFTAGVKPIRDPLAAPPTEASCFRESAKQVADVELFFEPFDPKLIY